MKKLFAFINMFFVTLLIGCDSSSSIVFDRSNKFHDEETQKLYVEQLQKDGVPHKVLPDGSVIYSSKDEELIKESKMKFLHDSFESHICYFDKAGEKQLLNALEAANIKYEIKEKFLGLCVTWAKEDDASVRLIKDKLEKPTAWFGSIDSERNFLKKLKERGIEYTIFEEDGHRKISWSKENEPQVDAIYEEIRRERNEKNEDLSTASPCKDSQEKQKGGKDYSDGGKPTVRTDFLQIPFEPHTCFFDKGKQKQFTDSLEKGNIKHEIKTTKLGLAKCIMWSSKDDYSAKQISKRMFNPSGWFEDLERERDFLEKLEKAGIEYTMYEEDRNRKISWSREDESRVDKIYEELARDCNPNCVIVPSAAQTVPLSRPPSKQLTE